MRQWLLTTSFLGGLLLLGVHLLSGRSQLGDILNEIWPLYLLAGGFLLAACIVLNAPKRLGWPTTLVALVGAGLLIAASEIWNLGPLKSQGTLPVPQPEQLTVGTFNVWASNTNLDATAAYLIEHEFDLISAQEVGLHTRDLPDRLRNTYPYQFTCGRGVYVFSRRPFVDAGCPDIPVGLSRRMPLAWVDVEWNGETMRFVAVHLARPMEMRWRRPQIARLEAFIAANTGRPMILAGDFNAGHAGRSVRELETRLSPMTRQDSRSPTWPSARLGGIPLLALDQIWLSPELCLLADAVGPALGSDHRPVSGLIAECGVSTASVAGQ